MQGKTNVASSSGQQSGTNTYKAKLILTAVIKGGDPESEEEVVNEAVQILENI